MKNTTLHCDYCKEGNHYVPIIEKPKRFGYKGKAKFLPQINNDGREVDNICLDCLSDKGNQRYILMCNL